MFLMEWISTSCGTDLPQLDESECPGWGQDIENDFDYDTVLVSGLLLGRDTVAMAALRRVSI